KSVVEYGNRVAAAILQQIKDLPAIGRCHKVPFLGVAHGWAGILYAVMRWCRAVPKRMPAGLRGRLTQLSKCAVTDRHGARWPVKIYQKGAPRPAEYLSGWCNGSA